MASQDSASPATAAMKAAAVMKPFFAGLRQLRGSLREVDILSFDRYVATGCAISPSGAPIRLHQQFMYNLTLDTCGCELLNSDQINKFGWRCWIFALNELGIHVLRFGTLNQDGNEEQARSFRVLIEHLQSHVVAVPASAPLVITDQYGKRFVVVDIDEDDDYELLPNELVDWKRIKGWALAPVELFVLESDPKEGKD